MDYVHTPNMTYLCVVPSCWNKLYISTPLLYIPPIRGFQYAIRHGSGLVCGFQFLPFGVSQPCSTRHSASIHLHVQLLMLCCDNFLQCQEAAPIPSQLENSVYVIVKHKSHEVICFCYPNWSWKLNGQETHLILLLPLQATVRGTDRGQTFNRRFWSC